MSWNNRSCNKASCGSFRFQCAVFSNLLNFKYLMSNGLVFFKKKDNFPLES